MTDRIHTANSVLAALWFGSLSVIGFMAVPLVFANLPVPAMAGQVAARLFAAQSWLSLVVVLMLMMLFRSRMRQLADDAAEGLSTQRPNMRYFTLLVTGFLLALLQQLVVAPHIAMRENLAVWHTAGTTLYVLQWLCALLAVLALARRKA